MTHTYGFCRQVMDVNKCDGVKEKCTFEHFDEPYKLCYWSKDKMVNYLCKSKFTSDKAWLLSQPDQTYPIAYYGLIKLS